MATISVFFGIAIRMYYDGHGPAHFHAYYGGESVKIAIETLEVLRGHVPRRALSMILEWAAEHRRELRQNWDLADQHRPLTEIAPLT